MINPIKLPPFKHFCVTIGNLPTSYVESLSYYEMLEWFCDYLQNTVIPALNQTSEAVSELQEAFTTLKSYVDNYFDNLDVQEEINNKLDKMAEDGTLESLFNFIYPVLDDEVGVANSLLPYGDIRRYNGKCDGVTDDKDALNNAITNALTYGFNVYIHDKVYVSETINTHGVHIIGDRQPLESGCVYPNGIGWNYPKNTGDGANITFSNYIETIPDGTCIVSDRANPILSTDYNKNFNLENFGVYGWLRNNEQEGLLVNDAPSGVTYYPGRHLFTKFSVFNTGSNAIHLHSLETITVSNLIIELCNGYGLYIEGLSNIDCPFDYNKFIDCRFRYTRLSAIYLYHTYRLNNEFNHCNFNYIGQHGFGEVNDIYGTRTQPASNSGIIYPITIDGLNYSTPNNQGRLLNLFNNYGEQSNGLLKITGIDTFVGLCLRSNTITKAVGTSYSCYLYSTIKYLLQLSLDFTTSNINTYYEMSGLIDLTSNDFLPDQFISSLSSITPLYKNTSVYSSKSFKSLYGDEIINKNYVVPASKYTYYNSNSGSEQTVTIDTKTVVDTYFKTNWSTAHGQPFTIALLSIGNGGNTTASPVCDLIAITRHNDKHFVSFITNNTNATADTSGVITITVPAYKIATLQIIQNVDSSY